MLRLKKILFVLLLLSPVVSHADDHDNLQLRGFVGGFISGAYLIPGLQSIESSGAGTIVPNREGAIGFTMDSIPYPKVNGGGHAFAFDIYNFMEVAEVFNSKVTENIWGFGIGYRYHLPNGLYFGASIMTILGNQATESLRAFGVTINDISVTFVSPDAFIPLTIGYNYIFDSGFTIGTRLFYANINKILVSSATANGISISTSSFPEINNLEITSIGVTLSYAIRR